jgi:multidrug transporter EmrE-like cation transporter
VVAMQRDVFALYIGIMVGIVGNFFVSTAIEMAKAEFEPKSPTNLLWFWSIMFVAASIITFQMLKWAMKKFDLSKRELVFFDYATVILTVIGIFVFVWDRFLR